MRKVKLIIPKSVMHDIGMKFRLYRNRTVMGRRQMHDLSAMPPLKPETIERKARIHKMGKRRGGAVVEIQKLTGKWRKRYNTIYVGKEVKEKVLLGMRAVKGRRGFASMYPDLPLVDSGNMVAPNSLDLDARGGSLTIQQGKTRAEIAAYHNEGGGSLPQRVHLSFNEEFIDKELMPVVDAYIDKAFRDAFGERIIA